MTNELIISYIYIYNEGKYIYIMKETIKEDRTRRRRRRKIKNDIAGNAKKTRNTRKQAHAQAYGQLVTTTRVTKVQKERPNNNIQREYNTSHLTLIHDIMGGGEQSKKILYSLQIA